VPDPKKRMWPSIRESLEGVRQGKIWDFTDTVAASEVPDDEWAEHMQEVYELIESSPERDEILAMLARGGHDISAFTSPGPNRVKPGDRIPYVIDNEQHFMADVLNRLLDRHAGKSFDVATAYFNVPGFQLLRKGLLDVGSFRLLLGDEPSESANVGLQPRTAAALRGELNATPYSEEMLRAVEDLIALLRREAVAVRAFHHGFLHAKAYLFYGDPPSAAWDRLQPIAAIVGSSNLTAGGLKHNRELNLAHKTLLSDAELEDPVPALIWPGRADPQQTFSDHEEKRFWKSSVGAQAISDLDAWFERQWAVSRDFKDELIDLLDASKFGTKEYSPYQVYMKALFEYFRDELDQPTGPAVTRSAIDLAEFQEDAVKKARKILSRYDGVLIGDSVGLGKTWIGKKLLEDYAYHMRQKALVICPASLRQMWEGELRDATIAATILSQEEMGRAEFDPAAFADTDVVLIDESHNFRTSTSQRYESLERLLSLNGGRGRDGQRKKVILLTATPINNDVFDLYNQISLITGGDRSYFAAAGIGDLQRYFINARRESRSAQPGVALFNLLEEVVIRRTRPFIRKAYPDAVIRGQPVRWPERRLRTVRYDLEATYGGIYDRVVDAIEGLRLAPYRLETFKRAGVERNEFEEGREEALVGIFKSRYLKRFESSVDSFRISVRRALEFLKTFESYVMEGRVLDSSSFHRAMRFIQSEDAEDDATPISRADELDVSDQAREFLASLPLLAQSQYDLRRLHQALQHDIDALTEVWHEIKDITPSRDAKLGQLKELLTGDLRGQKVLLFTYYKDTARYLYRELTGEHSSAWREDAGNPHIRRMDSGAATRDRLGLIQAFAPTANERPDLVGTAEEVDILISTDVLSEGQNLQDCGVVVNYDLHWNPTRMVQRAGRVDRLLSPYETIWIYNLFPDEGLEKLLGLVESLNRKITDIDRTGFLDASVLGETVHPRNFNTLKRIEDEDDSVVEEEEQFAELASNEFLLQQLKLVLDAGQREALESLPDGIHSGLARPDKRGVFFYFTAPAPRGDGRQHFWRYVDLRDKRMIDNRFLIANLIACAPDTPRVIGEEDVFALQDQVIDDIVRQSESQVAVEEAPKIIDPMQQTMATLLRTYLNHPDVNRQEVRELIRILSSPMPRVHVRRVRELYAEFGRTNDVKTLLDGLRSLPESPTPSGRPDASSGPIKREDLHLVCFDFVCS
jgi:superfamily II DNA or RNA helicase